MVTQTETGVDQDFAQEILLQSGIDVGQCYQCGKCTAGCPVAEFMGHAPNQIVRLVQLGRREEVLGSSSIWLCASCETCTARCPKELEVAELMDALRGLSLREGKTHRKALPIIQFHRSFLSEIFSRGRVFDLGLVMRFKMRSRRFFQDVLLAPVMLLKNKLKLLPKGVEDRKAVQAVFSEDDR